MTQPSVVVLLPLSVIVPEPVTPPDAVNEPEPEYVAVFDVLTVVEPPPVGYDHALAPEPDAELRVWVQFPVSAVVREPDAVAEPVTFGVIVVDAELGV